MTFQHPEPVSSAPRGHYVFIDGPSIDRTLGRVIGQAPGPQTRPDWRRLETFVKQQRGPAPFTSTFVFWAPGQPGFIHFLHSIGFLVALGDRFVPGQSCAELIAERIAALNRSSTPEDSWQLIVGTHDEELIQQLPAIADQAEQISVFGFTEFLPDAPELESWIDFYDIEDDAQLFRLPLARVNFDEYEDEPYERQPVAPVAFQPQLDQTAASIQPPRPTASTLAPPAFAPLTADTRRDFYLIVDGRSVDKEIGEILGEKPQSGTRPDWGTVLEFGRSRSQAPDREVKALFAHIAPGHPGFRHALKDLGFTASPVKRDDSQPMRPVVEEFVCGLLGARALRGHSGPAPDVLVVGHGQAIFDALNDIPDDNQRLCVLGFPERMPSAAIYPRIIQLDLEHDAQAFHTELPRELGINVDEFDPDQELQRLL